MDETLSVDALERAADISRDRHRHAGSDAWLGGSGQPLRDRAAGQELRDEEALARVLANVVDRDDVWVVAEPPERAHLAHEPRLGAGVPGRAGTNATATSRSRYSSYAW